MVDGSAGVDDHEFPVVRKGYDIGQVRAYLSEVEASFREWERWAGEAKARFEIAEDKARDTADEVDEAMIAVFAAKDRIVEQGRLRAEQIEAEARERARVDYEDAAGSIIREAEEQARRIVQEAREDADRVVGAARDEAEGLIAQAQANAAMSEDRSGDALVVDLTDRDGVDEADDDSSLRRTRYERRSAALPSLGEDASKVLRSLEGLREDTSTDPP
jgi:DivIVA domain-containing protein